MCHHYSYTNAPSAARYGLHDIPPMEDEGTEVPHHAVIAAIKKSKFNAYLEFYIL